MSVRKKKKTLPAPAEEKKKSHGGRRDGAGRKPILGTAMSTGIYIRCSPEQKEALSVFVKALSAERVAQGLPNVELSTWLRELGLKFSGNEELGLAAQARKAAEEAASIV